MSDSQEQPWSNNANAPNIMYYEYIGEKSNFVGVFIGSILYGMLETPVTTRPSPRDDFIYLACSRDRDRIVLPMYDRAI